MSAPRLFFQKSSIKKAMNPELNGHYYGHPNLRTEIIPVAVTGTTSGVSLDIDGSKTGLKADSQIVGMSVIDYVANGTTQNIAGAPTDLADLTILNGGVVYLKSGNDVIHKFPLSDLIQRSATEPFLRFPLSTNFDLLEKKSQIFITASNANVAANTGRVIGLVVRYLDPSCPV